MPLVSTEFKEVTKWIVCVTAEVKTSGIVDSARRNCGKTEQHQKLMKLLKQTFIQYKNWVQLEQKYIVAKPDDNGICNKQ